MCYHRHYPQPYIWLFFNEKTIKSYIKKVLVQTLAGTLSLLGGALTRVSTIIRFVALKPLQFFGRIIFHSILVTLYRYYLAGKRYVIATSGHRLPARWAVLINNRQTIHVGMFALALITVFTSTSTTRAENYLEETLLPSLVQPEFADEELIVETATAAASNGNGSKPIKYREAGFVRAVTSASPFRSEEEILGEQVSPALAQGGSAIIKQNVATTDIERRKRTENTIYVVQTGDTVTSIAREFDVTVNTILWENNLTAYSIIRPGKEITILPASGLTHTVKKNDTVEQLSKTYQVEPESILEANKLLEGASLAIGDILFIPNGLKPRPAPVRQYYQPSRSFAQAPSGGAFIWPTNSYRITQYFTWRHFGLDVGNRHGEPIYAAAEGEVVTASQGSWNGGYGNQVVIDHGNGVETRYAHNSYNLVVVGERVTQGQPIAAVGSTGRSSGPHVHFEIIIDNRRVNPLNYLSR